MEGDMMQIVFTAVKDRISQGKDNETKITLEIDGSQILNIGQLIAIPRDCLLKVTIEPAVLNE